MPNTKPQTRRSAAEGAPQQADAIPGDAARHIGGSPAQGGPVSDRAAWGSGHTMQQAAGHAEEAGRRLSKVVQQAAAGLIGGVIQTNLRLAQGMVGAVDSGAINDLQRHYVRDQVSAFTESAASIVRAAHHAADEAWRSLEARLEQRLRQMQQNRQQAQKHARRVADIMTPGARYVFEDEDPHHAAVNMAEQHVVRLPVLNRGKRLVGVVSLGDLTAEDVIASADADTSGVRIHKGGHSGVAAE